MPLLKKLLIISSLILFLFSCGSKDKTTVEKGIEQKPSETTAEIKSEAEMKAMITFLTGDVMQLVSGNWEYAEIGGILNQNDKIRVEADSYCEIQFSNRAVIRVEENTDVYLSTLDLTQKKSKIIIKLAAGSMLCKVEKLASDERFKIATEAVICSVRGTEFRITAAAADAETKAENTVLAVSEGAVAVTPPEFDVDKLAASAGGMSEAVTEILEKMEAEAPVVTAYEQLLLSETAFAEASEAVEKLAEIIEEIIDEEDNTAVTGHLQNLANRAETALDIISRTGAEIMEISAENAEKLETIKELRIIDISAQSSPDTDKPADPDPEPDSEPTAAAPETTAPETIIPAAAAEPEDVPGQKSTTSLVPVSSDKLIGAITTDTGLFFTSDSSGTVSAVNPDGQVTWSIETENKNVENSFPSAAGGLVCYSGAAEYLIMEAASGKVIRRQPMDKDSAHIFGRRLVPTDAGILLPANGSIIILDSTDGTDQRVIALPDGGSAMTPALYGSQILSVDPQGSLHFIASKSGKLISSISTGASQPIASGITFTEKNNLALFSGRKGTVACIDLNNKRILWEKQLPGSNQVFTDTVCSADAAHIFSKGKIFSLSLDSGEEIFPAAAASAPPAVIDNMLVYGSADGNIIWANAADGKIEKKLAAGDVISTRPTVLNGRTAAGTESGKLLIVSP